MKKIRWVVVPALAAAPCLGLGSAPALDVAAAIGHPARSDMRFSRGLLEPDRSPWTFHAAGLVGHFREPKCQACEYRTSVPGIGLEREIRLGTGQGGPIRYSLSGGVQSDSFGRSGGYAAAVASRVFRTDSLLVRPGIGGFAFYRYMEARAGRELMPAVLPVLSVEGVRSGFGASLLAAPNFSYGGTPHSGFVFLQMTYRLAP